MQFRNDINGLRAIAVIAVVLFHFNASWMPGGFAGVDVFFVISGFLMTGIIFRGIEQENFSILKFYVARANRIIPALAVLCLALLVFGWFYLTPLDYKALGKHVGGSMVFLSNIMYWGEAGYFDASAHEKWLLHTWSLSVEWQFYIIYPLVLVLLHKFLSLKVMKSAILLGTVLGFIFCVIASYKWPDGSYYLLPTRAWEMMIGGVAYLFPFNFQAKKKKVIEFLGLAMILSSYFLISKVNIWPGYLALFPVLGTFLVIQAQSTKSCITSNVVLQRLGSWSYSIYLWHWPLVVAIYYFSLNDIYIYIGIVLSVFLGFISNRYIEKIKFTNDFSYLTSYFRYKPLYMVVILTITSLVIFNKTKFFYNLPDDVFGAVLVTSESDGNSRYTWDRIEQLEKKVEFKNVKYKVLTIGDSQSGDFINTLLEVGLSHNVDVISRMVSARCEVFSLERNSLYESFKVNNNIINGDIPKERCEEEILKINNDSIVEQANVIIITMFWKDKNIPYVMESIRNIRNRNENAIIYVVGGKSFNKPIPQIIYESYYKGIELETFAFNELANNKEVNSSYQNEAFTRNQKNLNFNYINMVGIICNEGECFILNGKNQPLFYDNVHLTRIGAKYIGLTIKRRSFFPSDFYL